MTSYKFPIVIKFYHNLGMLIEKLYVLIYSKIKLHYYPVINNLFLLCSCVKKLPTFQNISYEYTY